MSFPRGVCQRVDADGVFLVASVEAGDSVDNERGKCAHLALSNPGAVGCLCGWV